MNETVKTPTVADLRKAGYKVYIAHRRNWKIAYIDPLNRKMVVKTVKNTRQIMLEDEHSSEGILYEMLPKGGVTEVTVNDPKSKLDFTATATCRVDENYNKSFGVERCLSRIIGLMLVCEYQNSDGFRVRVET